MPEVIRGSRASFQVERTASGGPAGSATTSPVTSPTHERRNVHFDPGTPSAEEPAPSQALNSVDTGLSTSSDRRKSSQSRRDRRKSHDDDEERDAYYDSRAATKREFRRRASTLQEYYAENPDLLPQLPFTWRRGWKRWKLALTIFLMVVDACVIPLVLFYTMYFVGNVQGWIIFAVVATIWGGPTYVEFAVRSWRLMKKEDFFRPLGTKNRWAFDITHWILVLTITSVTAFLVVGSAPHIVWIRVLSMPAPAILYCIGGCTFVITMYSLTGRKAPFRISSTPKGGDVYPGIYYIIEDVIAVNANAGRPFREALAARYHASPRFRRMIKHQSLFWSIPSVVVAIACTVVIVIHPVSKFVAYGIGWGVPFVWIGIWTIITIPWVRYEMHKETITWEEDCGISPDEKIDKKKNMLGLNGNDSETAKDPEPDTPKPEPEP